ncbi:HEXXH motif domain-containing protein [Streptomyces sp. SAJ15]|uniref:HEXXH motif domain-containing protein n=1 Tax=Streptomyces sp. SAJ15 TaxID=2011095 RepID=UPI0016424C7C|nr:HEXXH motif domain-containing protein [Streptomyces sp. SAJ15]
MKARDLGPHLRAGAPRHGLTLTQFDALAAGGGDVDVFKRLWEAERSHRMLLLDLLMDMQAERLEVAGPLPEAERAWELLVAAERRDRVEVERVLLLPETGLWLMDVLRRLRDPRHRADGAAPLWVETGHLHALAAAAAIRAGLDFSLPVPARSGAVWLPSVGRALLPDQPVWSVAQVEFGSGRLSLRGAVGPPMRVPLPSERASTGWQPPRRLDLDPRGESRPVVLDDLGHHHIMPTPPEALTDASAECWETRLRAAWALLREADPQSAVDIAGFLRSIEPLPARDAHRSTSATSGDGVGRLAANEQRSGTQLASVLTHEVQHSKLSALMHMYALCDSDDASLLYAPWRNDPRPLRGVLQGVYAFTAVARFWRGYCGRYSAEGGHHLDPARFEYGLRRLQLLRALPALRSEPALTRLGVRLVDRLTETVTRWRDEPLPRRVLVRARAAADDHAMGWRLHHLEPAGELTTCLADAWLTNPSRPPDRLPRGEPRLRADPQVPDLDVRAVLFRRSLADARALERDGAAESDADVLPPGARTADVRLALGDTLGARRRYEAEISRALECGETPPRDAWRATVGAWAGLGLVAGAEGSWYAAHALRERPELVAAVHRAVSLRNGAPSPLSLADWLGRALAAPSG